MERLYLVSLYSVSAHSSRRSCRLFKAVIPLDVRM